jgi:hypothetical protein
MTLGVVRGLQSIDVDVSRYELSAVALGAIDLAPDGSESGAAAAYPGQLIGPGIFAVPGGLRAILSCNLSVVAPLCAIVRGDLAVVDRPHSAVRGVSAFQGGASARVLRALTAARRAISRGSVEITGCVVACFGLLVAQPGRDVPVPRCQPGLPTAHSRQLVGPGILSVLRGLCAILGCDFAVVTRPDAAVGSLSAARVGPGTFVSRALTIARRAVSCGSIAITGRVITRFGLPVT